MQDKTALVIEQLKRDAKFTIGLEDDQRDYLAKQTEPFRRILDSLADETKAIRANGRLSFDAIAEDVQVAREKALVLIERHASAISRSAVIDDLSKRLVSKVATTRKANMQAQQDAAQLSTELRQAVLPKMIAEGEGRQIPAPQTVAKLVLQAAERYTENPSKHEVIINALSVGWPFTEDLPVDVLQQVDAVIAEQVAPDEFNQLRQAEGVQHLIDRVAEAAQMDCRG